PKRFLDQTTPSARARAATPPQLRRGFSRSRQFIHTFIGLAYNTETPLKSRFGYNSREEALVQDQTTRVEGNFNRTPGLSLESAPMIPKHSVRNRTPRLW